MKILLTLFIFLAGSTAILKAQKGYNIVSIDGKVLYKSTVGEDTGTILLKKVSLRKAKSFTVRFENYKKAVWKRSTWLENENVTDPAKYSYNLPSPNGTITIPASAVRTVLKGRTSVEIWTSLKPKNDMMMVRETRELICKIVID